MVRPDEKAPDFCLPDQDRNGLCLRDLRGSWVVLFFYPRDGSKGCTQEARDFASSYDAFRSLGAHVVGVSPDTPLSHKAFEAKNDLPMRLLSDSERYHTMLTSYGVWQQRKLYGREYMGVVRTTLLIDPKGTVVERWDRVRVPGHVATVLSTLSSQGSSS
ncbi:MAG TPA: peroxiredoxin [Methanomicrobia archaeon]|nr:peroxiredoxin [Methanomicrobia archaeon]